MLSGARKATIVSLVNSSCNPDSRVMRHASTLAAAGYSITVVCKMMDDLAPEEEVDGVRYIRVPMRSSAFRPRSGVFKFRAFASFVEKTVLALRPDIIDAHDLITLPAAIHLARMTGAKVLYDVHDLHLHEPKRRSRFAYWFAERTERKNIRLADAVITVSDGMAEFLGNHYGVQRPEVVMNSPSIKPDADGAPRSLRKELGLARGIPLGVYTGGRSRVRGLDLLVEALGQVSGLHLALVGHQQGGNDVLLRQIAEAGGYGERLHILQPVSHDSVVSYVASADFGILAYYIDCLNHQVTIPTKLFEAVFAGLPVAVADFRALRDFVEVTGTGLVMNAGSVDDMANTMRRMVAERDDFRLSPEKVTSLKSVYGWPAQAQRLLEVFDRLMG